MLRVNRILCNILATALEFATPAVASSDYVLLATTDASASASVSFDGYFSATYKNYKIIYSYINNATDDTAFRIRFRRSNADVTASNYTSIKNYLQFNTQTGDDQGANAYSYYNQNLSYINPTNTAPNENSASTSFCGEMIIFDPLNTASYKIVQGNVCLTYQAPSGPYYGAFEYYATLINNTDALSGITFFMSSGNITSGNFKLYGLK